MLNVWEVTWWNGKKWDECELYTEDHDISRVRNVFLSQLYNNEVCKNVTVSYEGKVTREDYHPVV